MNRQFVRLTTMSEHFDLISAQRDGVSVKTRILSLVALAAFIMFSSGQVSAGQNDPVTLGAPAYFSDAASWNRLLATPGLSHVIVNAYDSASVATVTPYVTRTNALGIRTIGYVPAGFAPAGSPNSAAAKTLPALQADVQAVFAAYPSLGGIFLDEVQNTYPCEASWVAYYASFSTWFRTTYPGRTLVFNSGAPLCSGFAGLADIYVMAERSQSAYASALSYYNDPAFDWIRALPNNQVWVINYGTPQANVVSQINDVSTVLGAGVVWMSDGATTNDYATLPSAEYLCTMAARSTGGACGSTATTVAPTTTAPAATSSTAAPVTSAAPVTTSAPVTTAPPATVPTSIIQVPAPTFAPTTTIAPATTTPAPAAIAATTTAAPTTTIAPLIFTSPSTTVAPNPSVAVAPAGASAPTTTIATAVAGNTVATPTQTEPAPAQVAESLVASPAFTG